MTPETQHINCAWSAERMRVFSSIARQSLKTLACHDDAALFGRWSVHEAIALRDGCPITYLTLLADEYKALQPKETPGHL